MVELISIHIPKCAGVSFEHTLKSVYGEEGFLRLHLPLAEERNPENPPPENPDVLPPGVRVIHGHFRYRSVIEKYNLDENIPLITWLREPASRVMSNYFYLSQVLKGGLEAGRTNVGLLNRMQKSLLEYADQAVTTNRMDRFLSGVSLDKFLFVGLVEHFSDDLADLAYLLGWERYDEFHHNTSASVKSSVPPEQIEAIRSLNAKDVALYNTALTLRVERRKRLERLGAYPIERRRWVAAPQPEQNNHRPARGRRARLARALRKLAERLG